MSIKTNKDIDLALNEFKNRYFEVYSKQITRFNLLKEISLKFKIRHASLYSRIYEKNIEHFLISKLKNVGGHLNGERNECW